MTADLFDSVLPLLRASQLDGVPLVAFELCVSSAPFYREMIAVTAVATFIYASARTWPLGYTHSLRMPDSPPASQWPAVLMPRRSLYYDRLTCCFRYDRLLRSSGVVTDGGGHFIASLIL